MPYSSPPLNVFSSFGAFAQHNSFKYSVTFKLLCVSPFMKSYFVCLVLYTSSMFGQSAQRGFTLEGRISGVENGTVVTLKAIDEKRILATATITNGQFAMRGHVDKPSTCWLECGNEYVTLQVENTNMRVETAVYQMRLYAKVQGGSEQSLQNELTALQFPFELRAMTAYDSLTKKLYTSDAQQKQLAQTLDNAQDRSQDIYVAFGKQHPDSWLGIDILYRNRKTIGKDNLEKILTANGNRLPPSPKVRSIREYVYGQLAAKGAPMIDFTVADIKGQPFTLSSLKGKYILLSFWDAGCGPCRSENKKISKHGRDFADKLSFVSFSLDTDHSIWEKASMADQIHWTNVSDGKGGAGRIKTLYDVQAIPAAFLVDPSGIIVETFTGFNDSFLEELGRLCKFP